MFESSSDHGSSLFDCRGCGVSLLFNDHEQGERERFQSDTVEPFDRCLELCHCWRWWWWRSGRSEIFPRTRNGETKITLRTESIGQSWCCRDGFTLHQCEQRSVQRSFLIQCFSDLFTGENNEMLRRTLELGISLLHGGNRAVQKRMLDYLKETKDVGCFTSLATLMANCSVLDLDTFERCIKAEVLGKTSKKWNISIDRSSFVSGVGSEGMAGEKNLHDADFTISLFRFCQLLCEGHNLEFQNYLRLQAGNNTNVNIIICTVDYLLSLQVNSPFRLIDEDFENERFLSGIDDGLLLALLRQRNGRCPWQREFLSGDQCG